MKSQGSTKTFQFSDRSAAIAAFRHARRLGFSLKSSFRYALAEFANDPDIRWLAQYWIRQNTNLLRY